MHSNNNSNNAINSRNNNKINSYTVKSVKVKLQGDRENIPLQKCFVLYL